jgi:hypothetical protein
MTSIYHRGKIYKLVNDENDNIYYGSTINALRKRLSCHKSKYKGFLEGKNNYRTSYEVVKHRNPKIILVEKYSCNDKDELCMRERYYIDNFPCVNKYIPCRTKKEYRENNKEKKIEYNKIYRENNKEKERERYKIYRENNKEKERGRHKIYYENNKEKERERHKIYRENNKENLFYINLLPRDITG